MTETESKIEIPTKLTGRWKEVFEIESKKEYFQKLKNRIKEERKDRNIYPAGPDVLNALKLTPFEKVKVVIIGQDPYPTADMAHGLAFSTLNHKMPPSLRVIFDEMIRSFLEVPYEPGKETNCNLTKWAVQGVLMMNTILTVEEGKPLSHKGYGWEIFTKRIFEEIMTKHNIIWMLWGAKAKEAIEGMTSKYRDHKKMFACHPQAQNYNKTQNMFVGCNHFYRCNRQLIEWGKAPISWDTNLDSPVNFDDWDDYQRWKAETGSGIFPYFDLPEQKYFVRSANGERKSYRKDLLTHPI